MTLESMLLYMWEIAWPLLTHIAMLALVYVLAMMFWSYRSPDKGMVVMFNLLSLVRNLRRPSRSIGESALVPM